MKLNTKIIDFKDLVVWQKSVDFVVKIYETTSSLPEKEKFGLISQIRRATISIPSNISEGSKRGTRKDCANFLRNSLGSTAEIETQLEICKRLNYIAIEKHIGLVKDLSEIQKMLGSMIKKLSGTIN